MQFTPHLIETIKEKFSKPLPGRASQYRMAHVGRDFPPSDASKARKAAVVILLFPDAEKETQLVLIQRMFHPKDRHACLLYTSPSPRDRTRSRMPSSA